MKNLFFALPALLAYFFIQSCANPAPAPLSFDLDRPFALKQGQTGTCSEVEGFSIRFDKVTADSRCPMGEKCITAGKADLELTLNKAGESAVVKLAFTLPNGTANVTEFKGHTIRVVGVTPFKMKDKEILPGDYSLAVQVTETKAAEGTKAE